MSQQEYPEALKEAIKAIKYADENIARDYFNKGVCETCLDMFKEALDDFDIALNLDPMLIDAYLLKGKTAYIYGDMNTAFECYQQMVTLCGNDFSIHIHAGNLLIISGAFQEAINAFDLANELKETELAHYQKAKVRFT